MILSTRQLLADKYVILPFVSAFITLIIQIITIARTVPVADSSFVIRTSIGFGPTQIGSWWELFVPFLIIFWLFLANVFFAYVIYERYKLMSRFLAFFSLAISIMLIVYTYQQSTSNITL